MKRRTKPEKPRDGRPDTLPGIFERITQLSKKLESFQRRTIRETGLTPPQYFLLGVLRERNGVPLKDLAAASRSTRATITGVVDTLERKGLVVREPHPQDRRSLLVKLTKHGRAVHDSAPETEHAFRSCCTPLERSELEQLGRLLGKLDRNLSFSGDDTLESRPSPGRRRAPPGRGGDAGSANSASARKK
jgi:DNA-binding MarR family transcriptional regulator